MNVQGGLAVKPLSIPFVPLVLAISAMSLEGQEHAPAPTSPASVVLFISDGASFETWNIAGYWARGERDGAPWSDWPVRLGMTTFALNPSTLPTMDDTFRVDYDPSLAWSAKAVPPDDTLSPRSFPARR
jgi:alkaline phosphatase